MGDSPATNFKKRLTEELVLQRSKCDHLSQVKSLNLWGNDLCDISVVRHMSNLEVLSLSVNRVETLQNFANCGRLVELYLRKNNITDLSEVQFLRGLGSLRVLWLSDNPCAKVPGYREYVLSVLPQLSKLDSMDVTFDVIDPGGWEVGWSWLPNLWKVRSRLSRSRLLQQKANFFCLRCTIFAHVRFLQASFQMESNSPLQTRNCSFLTLHPPIFG